MSLPRLLYITLADLGTPNGATEHIIGIAAGMARLGAPVTLLAPMSSAGDPRLFTPGLSLATFDPRGRSPFGISWELGTLARSTVREGSPAMIYLRMFRADSMFLTWRLPRTVPLFVELNTIFDREYLSYGMPWRGRAFAHLAAATLRHASGWLMPSAEILVWATAITRSTRPSRIVNNGFDPSTAVPLETREQVRARLGVPQHRPVVIMAGYSRPWHGARTAVDALATIEESAELWLIGPSEGAFDDSLRQRAQSLGVEDRLRLFPWLPARELASMIGAADVGLGAIGLQARGMTEVQAVKVPQYLIQGVPVVLSRPDVRVPLDAPFAYVAPSESPHDIAQGIMGLLECGNDARSQGREYARAQMTWDREAAATIEFLTAHLTTNP